MLNSIWMNDASLTGPHLEPPRIAAGVRRARRPVCALGTVVACLLAASAAMAQSRGELLYTAHCISCHTTQMHWRDSRAARDWTTLKFQVRRWQNAASLGWPDSDIQEVARYLNEAIYRFEQTEGPVSSLPLDTHRVVANRSLAPESVPAQVPDYRTRHSGLAPAFTGAYTLK